MHSAVQTHIYTIYIFLAIMVFNLYSVYKEKEFIVLAKRLKFLTPLYHSINAVVIYTGTIVAFYAQTFSFTIALMIPASIFLLVIEIKRYNDIESNLTMVAELASAGRESDAQNLLEKSEILYLAQNEKTLRRSKSEYNMEISRIKELFKTELAQLNKAK